MKIGFTGTRKGINEKQRLDFENYLDFLSMLNEIDEFHHGDCVGADAEAHYIIRAKFPNCKIIVHPPLKESSRAFCPADEVIQAKDFLIRNHDIVDSSDYMIAIPKSNKEEVRSGTWATIRYARKVGKKIKILEVENEL